MMRSLSIALGGAALISLLFFLFDALVRRMAHRAFQDMIGWKRAR